MTVRHLPQGETWTSQTGENEYVHVLLSGTCAIHTSQGDFANVGKRRDVFSGLPYALYLSRGVEFAITAQSEQVEVASCWSPTDQDHPAKLITPADVTIDLRGGGNASRQVVNIIPPGFPCHRSGARRKPDPRRQLGGLSAPQTRHPPRRRDGQSPRSRPRRSLLLQAQPSARLRPTAHLSRRLRPNLPRPKQRQNDSHPRRLPPHHQRPRLYDLSAQFLGRFGTIARQQRRPRSRLGEKPVGCARPAPADCQSGLKHSAVWRFHLPIGL